MHDSVRVANEVTWRGALEGVSGSRTQISGRSHGDA
jgi:hypothetical protein